MGLLNETGSYPGQPWLWLYQLWYHVPGFATRPTWTSLIYLTGAATRSCSCWCLTPGLPAFPRWIPVHRLVWRNATPGPRSPAARGPVWPNGPGQVQRGEK